jgi:tetratricopeptide (TPR) repeat protein
LPSSNFIVPAGMILAERTLFLPSAGVVLALVAAAAWAAPRLATYVARRLAPANLEQQLRLMRAGLATAIGGLLVAGAVWSARRTTVWHDNERLFRQTVIDSPNSYRAHHMLGTLEFYYKRMDAGEREYQRAIKLFPLDPMVPFQLATQYRMMGVCSRAIPYYRLAQVVYPETGNAGYAYCLVKEGRYAEARERLKIAIDYYRGSSAFHQLLVWTASQEAAHRSADSAKTTAGTVKLVGERHVRRKSALPQGDVP